MEYSQSEVLQYVAENDVKFIKLFFTDIFGNLKSISIQPTLLRRAFSEGISFDASAIPGFLNVEKSDLVLIPDSATLSVLPWRPQQGRVCRMYCSIFYPDGASFEGDSRGILKNVVKNVQDAGFDVKVGTECEFYLFKLDSEGKPIFVPHDTASYCDLSPLDKGENVRRDIILNLEQLGIEPETSHHESGPGQNEIDFKYSSALNAADNFATFKNTVKSVAFQDGLFASFAPKPIQDKAGSGLHINLSLYKNGENLIATKSPEASAFVAGILHRIREITVFLNPFPSSYQRLGKCEAPKYVSWSRQNRSQLIRLPFATGDFSRIELRSPDPTCNQYSALSLIIAAGLEGILQKEKLPCAKDINVYTADKSELCDLQTLPSSLNSGEESALSVAEKSDFVRSVLGERFVASYLDSKRNCTEPDFGKL